MAFCANGTVLIQPGMKCRVFDSRSFESGEGTACYQQIIGVPLALWLMATSNRHFMPAWITGCPVGTGKCTVLLGQCNSMSLWDSAFAGFGVFAIRNPDASS